MTSLLPFDSSNQDANMSCGTGRKAEMRSLILAERAARRAREFSKTHVDE